MAGPPLHLTRRRLLELGLAAAGTRILSPALPALAAPGRPRAMTFSLPLPAARRIGPLTVPGGLELAGLRWPGRAGVRAELRARRAGGSWTEWLPLGQAGDHGPDGGGTGGTDPVWTGPADEVELRLSRPVAGLRLCAVRTSGARRLIAHGAQAASGPSVPIISRAQWGGDAVHPRAPAEYGTVQMAFVHHTVNSNGYRPSDSAAMVLAIAYYHRDHNGWNDIGYNFLVDRYGQVFEGRAGGIDEAVVGAQAQGWNAVSTGVANLGTFTTAHETPAAMDAMARLIAWKLTLHGAPVEGWVGVVSNGGADNRYPKGETVSFQRISGHRDGCATDCPGNALYGQLPDLRQRTAAYAASLVEPGGRLTIAVAANGRGARPANVVGTLRGLDGTPLGGTAIALQLDDGFGNWTTVAQTVTGADGSYTADVPLQRTSRVRAWASDAGGEVASAPVTAYLSRALSVRPSAARLAAGAPLTLTLTAAPAAGSVYVTIRRRLSRGRYTRARARRVRLQNGLGTLTVRLRAGRYRIDASAPASGGLAASAARPAYVRAR